ncbi:MAG: hypothetical protein KKG95_07925, partial [Candidatus Omnitrophica bacterium]|nr:hypothetical protein [Candidatus Omnitrophota bacterium]
MLLGVIKSEYGRIRIGTFSTPLAIIGTPRFVHTAGNLEIVSSEIGPGGTNIMTLETARGDVLLYDPAGDLTLESEKGSIETGLNSQLSALSLKVIANNFAIISVAENTHIYRNSGDIIIDAISYICGTDFATVTGAGVGRFTYLKTTNITLQTDHSVAMAPELAPVMLIGAGVTVIARKVGTYDRPFSFSADQAYVRLIGGTMEIAESREADGGILIRGPTGAWGGILYNKGADLALDADSVVLTGSQPASFSGNILFSNFECTVPDKEIYFEAGKTYTILGIFRIQGNYGKLVKLLSREEGKHWYIDPQGKRDLTYAWVKDSDNIHPDEIIMTQSTSRGNNINWDPDVYWIADSNASWSTGSSWSIGVAPGSGDDVIFNSSHQGNSTLVASFGGTINSLTVSGYTGTITCYRNLTITGNYAQSSGTFNASSYNLTIGGDFNHSGGTFTQDTSTVTLNGAGAQSIGGGANTTFYNLDLDDTGARTITIADTAASGLAVEVTNIFT